MKICMAVLLVACHAQTPAPMAPKPVALQTHPCDIPPAPVRPLILEEVPQNGVLIMSGEQFNAIVKYEIDFVAWAQLVMSCKE